MAKKETARQKQLRLRREARARRTQAPRNVAPGTGRSRASRSRTVPSLMKKGETYGNPGTSSSSSKKNPRARSSRRPGLIGPPAPKAPTRSRAANRRSSSSTTPKTTPKTTTKLTENQKLARSGRRSGSLRSTTTTKPPKTTTTPPKTTTKAPKVTPKATKTTRKTSKTQGPTKSGGFYQSKSSSTKGGPTKSGSSYAGKRKPRTWLKDNYKPGVKGIKSSRLSKALSNLKVRKYKK